MKIDRLIGIIVTLQQKKTVTAPWLAEKFEVSRRTINRDIEEICAAGIPIVARQGSGGGLSIMEGFSLDTTVFTRQELAAILTGLGSLDSVSHAPMAGRLAGKLGGEAQDTLTEGMSIDLASFYKDDLSQKIGTIREAIGQRRCIAFHYYYEKGEADKIIEPYLVLYKWSDWYVFGFCRQREDFRMYKLRRLWELRVTQQTYPVRQIPPEKKDFGSHMRDAYLTEAVYEPCVKYRLVEEYGPFSFTQQEDGRLYARWGFSGAEQALRWFLGFGDKVRVLQPPELVEKMRAQVQAAAKKYGVWDRENEDGQKGQTGNAV